MANSILHAGIPQPIYGCSYTLILPFLDASGAPVDPTSPDTELSTDGGVTFSDCNNEITTGGGNGVGYITLDTSEMSNWYLVIAAKSSNAKTTIAILQPATMCASTTVAVTNPVTINSIEISNATFEAAYGTGFQPAGLWVKFETGLAAGQVRLVTDYVPSTGIVSFIPSLEVPQPSIGDNVRFCFPLGTGLVKNLINNSGGIAR